MVDVVDACLGLVRNLPEKKLILFGLHVVWDQVDRIYIGTNWGFRSGTFLESILSYVEGEFFDVLGTLVGSHWLTL